MKTLYPFQTTGVEFLASRQKALLADEQGLGKTVQAILAAKQLKARKILIVCPAVVKYVWHREITEWTGEKDIQVVEGMFARVKDSAVTVINYDLLASPVVYEQIISRLYSLGIFDEAHYLKGRDTKRTKAVLLRGGVASRCLYKWFMTGTPVLNRPVELYPLLKACAPELLGEYSSFNSFAHRYCGAYFDGYDLNVRGHSNVDELNEKLTRSGFMLRRLKSEVLHELPEKQYQIIPLGKEGIGNKKIFRFIKSDARKQTPASLDGGDLATERRELAMAKRRYVCDHVRSLLESERKVVVFAYHRDLLEQLRIDFESYNPGLVYGGVTAKEREKVIQDFRTKPECRVFLGQITAAGVGITLIESRIAVFAEISWVPGEIFQAVDRIHRIGQKEKVLIQFMVWENTLEEFMLRSVIDKKQVVEAIVEQKDEEQASEILFT